MRKFSELLAILIIVIFSFGIGRWSASLKNSNGHLAIDQKNKTIRELRLFQDKLFFELAEVKTQLESERQND